MSQKDSKKNKKQKTSHKTNGVSHSNVESPISPVIYTDAEVSRYASLHAKSLPYQHVVVENLCVDDRMRTIHEEITTNMKANFKETDLFKVFQTGDLAALDDKLLKKMPNVMALRTAVYSAEFRDVVSKITGCTDLTDRVDFSANVYANSCHLMCHDDVIGTRRVSFVIYLTDPDDPWVVTDGGAFEMFPLAKDSIVDRGAEFGGAQGIPESVPTACALPTYNTMMIFRVQPGRSYHAVQEVYSKSKPRLSISGWYHGPDPPKGADKASLQQIMTKGDDLRAFTPFVEGQDAANKQQAAAVKSDEDEEVVLTKEDLTYLKQFINPQYLDETSLNDINEQFCENSSLQLNDFIRKDLAVRIARGMLLRDHQEGLGHGKPQLNYTLGCTTSSAAEGEGWQLVGPPHKRRHLLYTPSERVRGGELSELIATGGKPSKSTASSDETQLDQILDTVRQKLFRSPIFAKYLQKVTSLKVLGYKDELRRFRAGLDYTVAHYGVLTKIPRLDATLCFVNDSQEVEHNVLGAAAPPVPRGEEGDEYDPEEEGDYYENLWESGDVGGFECYIAAEEDAEDAEAAEVYRSADVTKNKKGSNGEGEDGDNPEDSLLSVSASNNVLSLVMRDEGIMKFIKYVSSNAPGSRWDITSEYEIVVPPKDSDDEEDDNDAEDDDE